MMGAEIEWLACVVRFGPHFKKYGDPYAGSGVVIGQGDSCTIGPISGEMTGQDRNDILECCAQRYKSARVERHGKLWAYDLTVRPFKRQRA